MASPVEAAVDGAAAPAEAAAGPAVDGTALPTPPNGSPAEPTFHTAFRGYERTEVDAHIAQLKGEIDRLRGETDRLHGRPITCVPSSRTKRSSWPTRPRPSSSATSTMTI